MTAARLLSGSCTTESADPVVQTLLPRRDGRLLGKAVAIAFALHVPLIFLSLPERAMTPQPPPVFREPITIREFRPKPPEIIHNVPPSPPPRDRTAFLPPIEPVETGPVNDEPPVELDNSAPVEVDDLFAPPVAPPAPPGPLELFTPGVTAPVLIPGSKVAPEYPELARVARQEGSVVLRAIVRADGNVGEIEVLSARPGGIGFEEAAIEAVLDWRYAPATQHGRPVDVYFTIYVSFQLH